MGWAPLYLKQVAWVVIGGLTFLVMSAYDYHRLSRYAYVLYAISLLLLVVVFLEGSSTRGAQRWLAIGSFSFQPSEVAKVTLVLLLARYYSTHSSKSLMNWVIIPGILMFPGFLLILLQPDLGDCGYVFLCVSYYRSLRWSVDSRFDLWSSWHPHGASVFVEGVMDALASLSKGKDSCLSGSDFGIPWERAIKRSNQELR